MQARVAVVTTAVWERVGARGRTRPSSGRDRAAVGEVGHAKRSIVEADLGASRGGPSEGAQPIVTDSSSRPPARDLDSGRSFATGDASDPSRREAGDPSLGDVLSRDELRELLSPLSTQSARAHLRDSGRRPGADTLGRGDGSRADWSAILLLTAEPEDVAHLSDFLSSFDVTLVPTSHRFAALELFSRGRFSAVLAGDRALGAEAESFIARLRQSDPHVPLGLILEPEGTPQGLGLDVEPEVAVLRRPLEEAQLRRFFDPIFARAAVSARQGSTPGEPTPSGPTAPHGDSEVGGTTDSGLPPERGPGGGGAPPAAERVPDAAAPPRERYRGVEPTDDGPLRSEWVPSSLPVPPRIESETAAEMPDPLLGVRLLLQERDLESAVSRWSESDPGLGGLVVLDREPCGSWELRLVAPDRKRREQLWARAGRDLDESVFAALDLVSATGAFIVLGEPGRPSRRWAVEVMGRDPDRADRLASQLAPILRQMTPEASGTPSRREQFLRVLANRMRGCERRGERLAVVATEPETSAPDDVGGRFAGHFRASDWVEVLDRRTWVLLDQMGREGVERLRERLGELQRRHRLRVVLRIWESDGPDPTSLVDEMESVFREPGRSGLWFDAEIAL